MLVTGKSEDELETSGAKRKVVHKFMKRIALLGAGISGMSSAHTLLEHDCQVEIFEKELYPGGRLATSFVERNNVSFSFDDGAQYFTAQSSDFRKQVEHWLQNKIVAPWHGRIGKIQSGILQPEQNFHERFVGIPHMRAVATYMAKNLNIATGCDVEGVRQLSGKWILQFKSGDEIGHFDAVIISMPPPQAVPLLQDYKELQDECSAIFMNPCWSTLVSFESSLPLEFDGIFGEESAALRWVCRDSSKPQRSGGERWVLHASNEWTRKHLNENGNVVGSILVKEFLDMTKMPPTASDFVQSHLWLDAAPTQTDTFHNLAAESKTLRLCGDWCHSGKVEGAFLSGQETARSIISVSGIDDSSPASII